MRALQIHFGKPMEDKPKDSDSYKNEEPCYDCPKYRSLIPVDFLFTNKKLMFSFNDNVSIILQARENIKFLIRITIFLSI